MPVRKAGKRAAKKQDEEAKDVRVPEDHETVNSEKVYDYDKREDRPGREASADTIAKRDKPVSAQEPQPQLRRRESDRGDERSGRGVPQDYDTQDHMERSRLRKATQDDPLQTPKGVREYKYGLAREEGAQQEAPVPRGLPLVGAERRADERRRGVLRDSDIGQPTDDELQGNDQAYVLIELCKPLRTWHEVNGPIYKQEDAPFRVTPEVAERLFALRNDMHQPIFRNYKEDRVTSKARTQSGAYVEEVDDEVPVVYRRFMERQRPNNQAPEDEVVLTQRGVVSKGRDDVEYGPVEDEDERGDMRTGTMAIGSRTHVRSVPERARRNSGDLQSGELKKGGGVKV